jgi:hypothetical protein
MVCVKACYTNYYVNTLLLIAALPQRVRERARETSSSRALASKTVSEAAREFLTDMTSSTRIKPDVCIQSSIEV